MINLLCGDSNFDINDWQITIYIKAKRKHKKNIVSLLPENGTKIGKMCIFEIQLMRTNYE